MNTKNKSQIEVKSIQYKERSYYEWGSNIANTSAKEMEKLP